MSEKKSITGSIREMEVGEQLVYPLDKRIYLQNVISYRLKSKESWKRWSLKSDSSNKSVTITRLL